MAATATFDIFQGDPFTMNLFSASNQVGNVLDLTGVTEIQIEFTKLDAGGFSDTVEFTLTLGSGVTIVDATTGAFDAVVSSTNTLELEGRFRGQTTLTLADGSPRTNASIILDIDKKS